jgi:hypothetical protein
MPLDESPSRMFLRAHFGGETMMMRQFPLSFSINVSINDFHHPPIRVMGRFSPEF